VAARLTGALVIGLATLVVSGIAWLGSLGACRGENVGSSGACGPVDDHPLATFWLAVVLPALVTAAVVGVRPPAGRWGAARFAPMAAWAIYLVVVLITSPHS
jgi:hypothetical protein